MTAKVSLKPKRSATSLIELLAFRVIAVEEREERGLRAGGAFDAAEAQGGDAVLDLLQIEDEILRPEACPLADGGELGGLEVRVAEGGQVFPLDGEGGQGVDGVGQADGDQLAGHRAG